MLKLSKIILMIEILFMAWVIIQQFMPQQTNPQDRIDLREEWWNEDSPVY